MMKEDKIKQIRVDKVKTKYKGHMYQLFEDATFDN